jgi:hypothetical protein
LFVCGSVSVATRASGKLAFGVPRGNSSNVAAQAKNTYRFQAVRNNLEARGVHVLAAGSGEVTAVCKYIREVMAAQRDLVETVGQFDPKIVRMCGAAGPRIDIRARIVERRSEQQAGQSKRWPQRPFLLLRAS